MNTSTKLTTQLTQILSGDAWYGTPVYPIIEQVSFEAAFEKPPGSIHNIAEIVLHMLAWTEEVMDRMNGMTAGLPSSGDWPETGAPTEQKWQNYVDDLKLVSVNLLGVIQNFPEEQWKELINDERGTKLVVTYEQMIIGFIQHQVYHAGQIAILTRMIQTGH